MVVAVPVNCRVVIDCEGDTSGQATDTDTGDDVEGERGRFVTPPETSARFRNLIIVKIILRLTLHNRTVFESLEEEVIVLRRQFN